MKHDEKTLKVLQHLTKKGYITKLFGPIKEGKESVVYYSKNEDGREVAVKVYLYESSMFKRMMKYVKGDYRFFATKRKRRLSILIWVKKEFQNLKRVRKNGILNVPEPLKVLDNVLVMSFIGVNGISSPLLKNCSKIDDLKVFKQCVKFIKKLHKKAGLVHADLSEYNILIKEKNPYFIDFSSAVVKDSENALNFLENDISKVYKFFKNREVKTGSERKLLKELLKNV